jgi:hypothetical protein
MARNAIEAEARQQKAKLNGQGDTELLYFHEMIYAPLAACSVGEVPDVGQAFQFSPEDLDGWFETVRAVNPDWFEVSPLDLETVELRDGSQITVVAADRPSVLMKLHRLEGEAEKGPRADSVSAETFRLLYYPRLAACSLGDVPTLEEARSEWPTSELDKWYQAWRRLPCRTGRRPRNRRKKKRNRAGGRDVPGTDVQERRRRRYSLDGRV